MIKTVWHGFVSTVFVLSVALAFAMPATAQSMQVEPYGRSPSVTEVPCNSGPLDPVQLRVLDRGDICFGGPNGVESVGLPVSFLDSGSYYGSVMLIEHGECIVKHFRARQVLAINAVVVSIYLGPPEEGTI